MGLNRFEERNRSVRTEVKKQFNHNPDKKVTAIIRDVAAKYFLSPKTVEHIISCRGYYKV